MRVTTEWQHALPTYEQINTSYCVYHFERRLNEDRLYQREFKRVVSTLDDPEKRVLRKLLMNIDWTFVTHSVNSYLT